MRGMRVLSTDWKTSTCILIAWSNSKNFHGTMERAILQCQYPGHHTTNVLAFSSKSCHVASSAELIALVPDLNSLLSLLKWQDLWVLGSQEKSFPWQSNTDRGNKFVLRLWRLSWQLSIAKKWSGGYSPYQMTHELTVGLYFRALLQIFIIIRMGIYFLCLTSSGLWKSVTSGCMIIIWSYSSYMLLHYSPTRITQVFIQQVPEGWTSMSLHTMFMFINSPP